MTRTDPKPPPPPEARRSRLGMPMPGLRLPAWLPAWLLPVLPAALAVRILYLFQYRASPFPRLYAIDQLYYRSWALKIAAGDWLGRTVFEMAPLYAYLLGGAYRLLGESNAFVLPLQLLAGAVTALLAGWCAREVAGERAALAGGVAAAVYGPFVYYECMIMKTFLEPLLVMAALSAGLCGSRSGRRRGFAAAGLFVGLACLVREVHVLLLLPLAAAAWLAGPGGGGRLVPRLAAGGALLAGFLLAMAPSTIRNLAVSRSFVLSTTGGGAAFYLAFGPQNTTGYYSAPDFLRTGPFLEAQDFRDEAAFRSGKPLTRGEASRYWYLEAREAALRDPGRVARIVALRALAFFHDAEIPDSEDYRVTADYLPLLRFLPSFGAFAGLGFLGVVVAARLGRRSFLPLSFAAVLFGEVLLTNYFGRYRVAFCAVWMIFVGVGVSWLLSPERLRGRAPRAALLGAAAAALLVSVLSFRLPPGSESWMPQQRDEARRNLAAVEGRLLELARLEAGIAGEGAGAESLHAYGKALEDTGNYVEASRAYEEAIRRNPVDVETRRDLASLHGRLGEYERAAAQAAAILEMAPGDAESHFLLGAALARLPSASAEGEEAERLLGEAERHLRTAVAMAPDAASARYLLGRVLRIRGDREGALRELDRALGILPGFPEAARDRATLLALPAGS